MSAEPTKRLLVVVDEMEVGGSQRQIVHLLSALDPAHWRAELVYFRKPSHLLDQLRVAGVPVHHVAKRGRVDPGFFLRLRALIARGDYDLVHAFSLTAELWTMLACRSLWRAPPLVSSVRSLNLDAPSWQWRTKRLVLGNSAAVIANADAAADAAAALSGLPRARFDVVGNGVALPAPMPDDARRAVRLALGAPQHRPFGLFVGRLIPVKDLPCLFEALAALPPERRPWMALAGDGHLRAELQQLRSALGLDRDVLLLGERDDVTRLVQAADFLVLCSRQEGLSNALLEAMAAGCPVIASRVGGTPELVDDGFSGLLFEAGDAAALAVAIGRMAGDAQLRARLSACARERVASRHGVPRLVEATLAIYERCLAPLPGSEVLQRT